MMLQPTMLLWAVVAAVVTSAQARTSAGGACTTITDKSECCKVYDNRVSVKHASNCVPAADTFSDGSVCEAEEIIVTRGECALVGACQEHVQLASAACLGLVVDKLKVAGDMVGPWIAGVGKPVKAEPFLYNGRDLQLKKDHFYVFAFFDGVYDLKHIKMTGVSLSEMVDESGYLHTSYDNDRYIALKRGADKSTLMTQDSISKMWDGDAEGYITVTVPSWHSNIQNDANGKGYQLTNIDISVKLSLFTTQTTVTSTTMTTTTTTNTVFAQMSKDLASLKAKLTDQNVAKELQTLIGSVQTLDETLQAEVEARKRADAEVVTLKAQVATLLPLSARLEALESSFNARLTLPAQIKAKIQGLQYGAPTACTSGACAPEMSSTDADDLALTVKSGTVLMETSECGPTDMCTLVRAVQAMLEQFD